MKRTLLLLILFVVLGSGTAWYFATNKTKGKTTYDKPANMDFAVEPELIHKIFIADRSGVTSTLTRNGDHWLVAGKYKVRPTAIANLLQAISQAEVKYRPPRAAIENIVKDFSTLGIKVEIYDKSDKMIKSYYVGGGDQKGTGTYMIMAGSDEPFAMHIPMMEGNMRPRYFLQGEEWRDRAVFNEKPEDIQSVSVEFPKQKNKSFKLSKEGGTYKVEPFYESQIPITSPYREGMAEKYLEGFRSMIAESFQNEHPDREAVSATIPFATITITNKNGETKWVKFHPFTLKDKNGEPMPVAPGSPVFRFNANTSWGDFMLVQQRVFEKAFWSYESFFKET